MFARTVGPPVGPCCPEAHSGVEGALSLGPLWGKCLPLLLTLACLILDQATKYLVVKNIRPYHIGASFFGDFFRLIHVYNPGIAFSIGNGLPMAIRGIAFAVIPLFIVTVVLITYFRSDDFSALQRWASAGVIGGGLGHLMDRFFRPEGVVDFIDIKFYGLFGLERWPTFNIADLSVLVCAGIFMLSVLITAYRTKDDEEENEPELLQNNWQA
jgi:signal peptidase II